MGARFSQNLGEAHRMPLSSTHLKDWLLSPVFEDFLELNCPEILELCLHIAGVEFREGHEV